MGCSALGLGPAAKVLYGVGNLPLWVSDPSSNEEAQAGADVLMGEQ